MTTELALEVPASSADAATTVFALALVGFLTAAALAATGLDAPFVSLPTVAALGVGTLGAWVGLRAVA